MKTIFLSFLGTNKYAECSYKFPDGTILQNQYTQATIIEKYKNQIDQYLFFLTAEAKQKNWEATNGLQHQIVNLGIKKDKITTVDIPNGFSKDELLQIFDLLIRPIPDNARLIIDVTHAFRSLPLNLSAVLNYLKIVKQVQILHIFYGAFEKLGRKEEVEKISIEQRIAPMLDITYLSAIQDWSLAIDHFLKFGNIDKLKELSKNAIDPILKETRGKDEVASAIREVVNRLEKLLQALYTCRIKDIRNSLDNFSKIKSSLNTVTHRDNNCILPQIVEPFSKLKEKLDIIHEEDSRELQTIKLVQWCIDYNWIQQGYTLLQENLLSYLIVQCGKNPMDTLQRECLSQALNIIVNKIPEQQWKTADKEKVKFYIDKYGNQIELCEWYKEISECRNDINHAGYRENPIDAKKIAEKLSEFYAKTLTIINNTK